MRARAVAEQLGRDAARTPSSVSAIGARLLEDLLLHVVAVGPEFGRAAVRLHRAHLALDRAVAAASRTR